MAPEESAWWHELVPVGAIKEKRGDRSQIQIARAAGMSQGFLSELECGRKRLTLGTAQKLAPVLGTTPDQLMLAERWVKLHRAAQKGRVDYQVLLAEAKRLAEMLPIGEIGDEIIDALIGIARAGPKPLM